MGWGGIRLSRDGERERLYVTIRKFKHQSYIAYLTLVLSHQQQLRDIRVSMLHGLRLHRLIGD